MLMLFFFVFLTVKVDNYCDHYWRWFKGKSMVKRITYTCALFGREEFESECQDKLAEYEVELKEWKKEAKRRVTV